MSSSLKSVRMKGIFLRPARPEDKESLLRVYASTRADEMSIVPWTDAQKDDFVRMQFHAQHVHYTTHYPDAEFSIIVKDDQDIGRIYIDRRGDEIRIVDIALLPDFRRSGIGTGLIRQILDEGDATGKPVRIHVERFNSALRLYERLGFNVIRDAGVYFLMEYRPTHSR